MEGDLMRDSQGSLSLLKDWYNDFIDATNKARGEAEKDRDYYDGIQWTDAEIKELNNRGQPVVTVNRIGPKLNYILGSEIRTRTDPHAYPRNPASDQEAADAATDALRYVDDAEELDQKFSEAAESGLIEGYGGAIIEVEQAGDRDIDVRVRHIPWDRIWYDPHSRKRDFSDARYIGVCTWMDTSDVIDLYGDGARAVIEATASQAFVTSDTFEDRPSKHSWWDRNRKRVLVSECYWREGRAWKYAHYSGGGFLREPAPVPFANERGGTECPVVLWSAFVDRQNQRYGIVRMMRSPQDELNKRRSKALHLLSVRQIIAEKGAVDDPDDARQEAARPDGYLEVMPGMRFELNPSADFTSGHLALLAEAKGEINATGPSSTSVAESPTMSGRAFIARQQAASMQLEPVFDSFRRFKRAVFRQIWCRIRQYWTFEKWVRIRDDEEKAGFRFVGLNRRMGRGERLQELLAKGVPLPSAVGMLGIPDVRRVLTEVMQVVSAQMQQVQPGQLPPEAMQRFVLGMLLRHPEMQLELKVNDIERLGVDIILDETPDVTVIEQEEYENLSTVGPMLVQAGFPAPMFAQMLIEASQFRNKKKMLEIIRQAQAPNPQAQQMQQQQAAMAIQGQVADIRKTLAQAAQSEASASKTAAETQLVGRGPSAMMPLPSL